jgi:hypothetical protein
VQRVQRPPCRREGAHLLDLGFQGRHLLLSRRQLCLLGHGFEFGDNLRRRLHRAGGCGGLWLGGWHASVFGRRLLLLLLLLPCRRLRFGWGLAGRWFDRRRRRSPRPAGPWLLSRWPGLCSESRWLDAAGGC